MLTLQKNQNLEIISTSTNNQSIDKLLSKEWLLTNGRGSYASSTITGCNTRGYHGLLIGSLNPPQTRPIRIAGIFPSLAYLQIVIS